MTACRQARTGLLHDRATSRVSLTGQTIEGLITPTLGGMLIAHLP